MEDDLSDLPPEVLKELRIGKDGVIKKITLKGAVLSAVKEHGAKTPDEIIITVYRKHKIILTRKQVFNYIFILKAAGVLPGEKYIRGY